jgi:hypothetical protein
MVEAPLIAVESAFRKKLAAAALGAVETKGELQQQQLVIIAVCR